MDFSASFADGADGRAFLPAFLAYGACVRNMAGKKHLAVGGCMPPLRALLQKRFFCTEPSYALAASGTSNAPHVGLGDCVGCLVKADY